ncbi:uncharacterized protein E0L32_012089 [Thyridium curvatum]|uniref:Uncharacterized protein n=1 Tax=Thyridium curvatum TaxID=1093900 RepID=A0A507BJP1_9PEZI|nr:uncharacterized protein E0L32_012089 [Thyridium curvatum]TPX17609.1 hypothetical protein E0L32_012089 [Thyridium curvatum]
MATHPTAFYCLWQEERIREKLFQLLPREDICSVRLANSACCNLVTKRLFLRTHLNFTSNTFTKTSRIQALSRIGHHIEHLTFYFAHSEATFLPPLIHPLTGREISFLYTPHTSMGSVLARPKYGNSELGDILTQQYPPLFHAATNVPSFINAMKHMPNMRHLTIRCPGQQPQERYRRDVVDYALISLRISLERTPLHKLSKLSLAGVHPSSFNYLRHVPGFGCMPSAGKRWRQIRKLYIAVDSWDFYGPSPGLDHLKIIDDYVRNFAPNLEKLSFTWLGRKGPCPLALSSDPLFAPPRSSKKLFNEVTSPMSPLPPAPARAPIHFPRLRYLTVRNATMNAPQLRTLVATHQATVREFDFENVALISGGSWDDALAPLMDQNNDHASDVWSRHSIGGTASEAGSIRPTTSSSEEPELPSPSAAVAAASRELLDLDVEGLESFLGLSGSPTLMTADRFYEDEEDSGLASDIAAAKEASTSFSTKLKKKRIRRRKKHRRDDREGGSDDEHRSRHRHKHSNSSGDDHHRRQRSRSAHHGKHHRRHRKAASAETLPSAPAAASQQHSPPHRFAHLTPPSHITIPLPPEEEGEDDVLLRTPTPAPLNISAPVQNTDPLPVLLQPTTYDPSSSAAAAAATAQLDDGLSAVQRNIEMEEAHRRLAEDAEARTSALKRAKEAVLMKLGRDFQRKMGAEHHHHHTAAVPYGRCASPDIGRSNSGSSGAHPWTMRRRLFGEALGVLGGGGGHDDRRPSMESNSALVPLMFSRA